MEIRGKASGIEVQNHAGWTICLAWTTGEIQTVTGPPGARRNDRRRPKEKELRRIQETLTIRSTGILMLDFLVAALPDPRGTKDKHSRARTIAILYRTAQEQGACPRSAIAHLYGMRLDPKATHLKSSTLDRWIKGEARDLGYLPKYDPTRDAPKRWPNLTGHPRPFEPKRGEKIVDTTKPSTEGTFAGEEVTLFTWRTPYAGPNHPGERVIGPDVVVEAHWTGQKRGSSRPDLETIEPLTAVPPQEVHQRIRPIIQHFEKKYPGASVKWKHTNNSRPPDGYPNLNPK